MRRRSRLAITTEDDRQTSRLKDNEQQVRACHILDRTGWAAAPATIRSHSLNIAPDQDLLDPGRIWIHLHSGLAIMSS